MKITIHEKVVEKVIIFLDFGRIKLLVFFEKVVEKIIIFFKISGGPKSPFF